MALAIALAFIHRLFDETAFESPTACRLKCVVRPDRSVLSFKKPLYSLKMRGSDSRKLGQRPSYLLQMNFSSSEGLWI